jgi:hypothetical protein
MWLLFILGRLNCKENFQNGYNEVKMHHTGNHFYALHAYCHTTFNENLIPEMCHWEVKYMNTVKWKGTVNTF